MGSLSEYVNLPEVRINGKKYVDEELLVRIFEERFLDARKDCESEDELIGIDMCRIILQNWLMHS